MTTLIEELAAIAKTASTTRLSTKLAARAMTLWTTPPPRTLKRMADERKHQRSILEPAEALPLTDTPSLKAR